MRGGGTLLAMTDFVHLHLHSDYSMLDGACRIDRLVGKIKSLGMKACALTDHGNLFGAVEFYKQAKDAGVKPLIGCEVYLVEGSRLDKTRATDGEKGFYHMGLLARDQEGYQNLLKIVSDSHVRGFYYKPRTDLEFLAAHSKGLIAFSGCLAALVPQALLNGDYELARKRTGRFVEMFGRENFIIEIQDHGLPEQRKIIPDLLRLAKEFDLKVIASNDVHYVNAGDAAPHDTMLCIQTGAKLADEKRMRFDSQQFYIKSGDEMARLFAEVPESISNTLGVAEMCDIKFDFSKNRYPVYPLPDEAVKEGVDRPTLLKRLCTEGLVRRYCVDYSTRSYLPDADPVRMVSEPDLPAQLCERVDYEVGVIERMGFVDYFLIVADFIAYAKSKDIPVGPGRGSGAGCLVAYLLRITDIDPIRYRLLFERFLNPERVSPPDFDIDFCMRRRDEVIEYVRKKYGEACVANIATFGTFGAKTVIRDIARVQDIPFAAADRLAKMIPDGMNPATKKPWTLDEAIAANAELQAEIRSNEANKMIVEQGKVIEGMARNVGKHAAGIVIVDRPMDELVPVTLQEGALTTQYSKDWVEKLGLLKMDFLGLKTLTIIDDAVAYIRRTHDPKFTIEKIPLDDPRTYALINSGRTVGVFQLESGGMQNACRMVGVDNIDDVNAVIALYRPGPMEFIPVYAKNKRDPASIDYRHPLLEPVLKETYGIIVYQEQVMECARVIAGYSLGGADMLRRAMGKKKKEEMDRQRSIFIEGAKKTHGIPEKKAEEIFELLDKFAQYGFNKSHSAAYALLTYQTAYLKANFPVQFMASVLSNEAGDAEKVSHFIAEATTMGIRVLGPDVNESRHLFTPVIQRRPTAPPDPSLTPAELLATIPPGGEGSIRFGLAAVKGVGEQAASKIVEEREANGPFASLQDFLSRVDGRAVNKRVLENLIKTGAFDATGALRGVLLKHLDSLMAQAAANQRDRQRGQTSLFDLLDDTSMPSAGGAGTVTSQDEDTDLPLTERLRAEKELLGLYLTGHPLDRYLGIAEALTTHAPDALATLPDRTDWRICGLVSGINKRLSKKDNLPWAMFTLSTREASVPLQLFPEAYQTYGDALAPETAVVVQGSTQIRNGEARVNVDVVLPVDRATAGAFRKVLFVIRPGADAGDFLNKLRDAVDRNRGNVAVEVGFLVDDSNVLIAEVPASLHWAFAPEDFLVLRQHPAVVGCQIDAKPVQPVERKRPARRYTA
jgi:DNA polymerase-3 subunit alpha